MSPMLHVDSHILLLFSYVYAGSIVLFGILLNVYRKNPDKVNNLMTCCFSKTKVLKQPSEIV